MASKYRHAMRMARMGLNAGFGFKMSASNGEATIDIYDQIGSDGWDSGITAKQFKAQLDALGDVNKITLRMDSPGGYIMDGFTIYNLLSEHKAHITGIVDGMAASIASVILMACDTVIMKQLSFIMLHKPSSGGYGNADELRGNADQLDKMEKMANKAYQDKTGLSEKEIADLLTGKDGSGATWMTPEDALDYGFADKIDSTPSARQKNKAINKGKLEVPSDILAIMEGKRPISRMLFPRMSVQPIGKPEPVKPTDVVPPQQGVKRMKCPKCGKEHSAADALFCSACGTDMKADPTQLMKAAHEREIAEAKAEGARLEALRISEITARCQKLNLSAVFQQKLIADKVSIADAAQQICDELAKGIPDPVRPATGNIRIGATDEDKFRTHAVLALGQRHGLRLTDTEAKDIKGQEFPSGLQAFAKKCLLRAGVSYDTINNMNESQLADVMFGASSIGSFKMESSGEFPSVLGDFQNKTLLQAYDEAPVTFPIFTRVIEVKDFKTAYLIKTSNFSDIKDILEGEDFKMGRFSDKEEQINIGTKGIAFMLTRRALINDDLGAFVRSAQIMASAVRRRQNTDAYDVITSASLLGPTMNEDSVALFDLASHYNLFENSGVPTSVQIAVNNSALRTMPLPKPDNSSKKQFLNLVGKYLLTGTKNERTIRLLLGAPNDLSVTNSAVAQAPNLYSSMIPVFDPYLQSILDEASVPNAWYMLTDQMQCGHLTQSFLAGQRVPILRGQPSFVGQALGMKWDIYMEWGFGIEDWRGMTYNDGVTAQ